MTQMMFQMQQMLLVTPQHLANPLPLPGSWHTNNNANNINANPGNPIPPPTLAPGAVASGNGAPSTTANDNTTPPPGTGHYPPAPPAGVSQHPPTLATSSVNVASQHIAPRMTTPTSSNQVETQHSAQSASYNLPAAAASMLRPNYLLAPTGNSGTIPTATVQHPMSTAFTPLFNNNAIVSDQQSHAGSSS